jgi:teichuronic acid biosynthesis glycosyltransferase TuaC
MSGKSQSRGRRQAARTLSVLHVFRYFRPDFTGEGLYFEKIVPLLSSGGVSNSVLVLTAAKAKAVKETSIATGALPIECLGQPGFGALAVSLSLFWWAIRHSRQYQVVHFHTHGDRYFVGKIAMRLLGCRIVQSCTLDDSPPELVASYNRAFRPLVAMLLRVIDLFIVISPRLREAALSMLPSDRVRFIPQGVALPPLPTQSRDGLRAELGFAVDDVLLLFVGALIERKGVLFLIEMMPRLRAKTPDIKLILVGPAFEDEYRARIAARVAQLGLADCVHIIGYLDDPSPYYRISDIFVFASYEEGLPNVLIEAMAYRLPVVARLLPGVSDYIIHSGITGFLFSDPDEYCALIERLAADLCLRDSIGKAARAHVEQKFDLVEIAAKYRCAYAGAGLRSKAS